jgi:PilZ domain
MAGFFVRKNQRIKRLVPVRYLGNGIIGEGIIKDFSLNGSYITGNVSVSIGAVLTLQIFIPGDPEPLLIDRATVKWVKGSDFGVDFDTSQSEITDRIAKIIATLVNTQHGSVHNG